MALTQTEFRSEAPEKQKRVIESCARCLFDKQQRLSDDPGFLKDIREILARRSAEDTAPYLVYLFGQVYEKRFGPRKPYAQIKRKYNDLVLGIEDAIRHRIASSDDPLKKALSYARAGNYIDFGAMISVNEDEFLRLLEQAELAERDLPVMESLVRQCAGAKKLSAAGG